MKRGLLIGGGVVVVLALAGVWLVYSSLDSLVRTAVEKYGSEITRTEVRLNEAVISATSGEGVLRGLQMGNPSGFKSDSAFRLGEVRVRIDIATLGRDTVVIKEVLIAAPRITYELGPNGSNIDAIRRNVESYVGTGAGRARGGGAAKGGGEAGKKLVIEDLYIRGGKVGVSATALEGKTLSAPLPDIHLTGIGKDTGGATPGEVLDRVIGAVGQGAGKAVASLGLGKMLGAAKERAAGATEAVAKGTAGARDLLDKGARDAEGTLKKLFGK
ncbi:MAG: hypothetical protein ACE5FR_01285 [Rhodospirillales bacterium]